MDDITEKLLVSQIQIKNFRCFVNVTFNFENLVTVIQGSNGVGKTSFIEALYYGCYLRSFRTHSPRDLINFGNNNFFIRLYTQQLAMHHEIQVGFSAGKRLVKIDQKIVSSYKELMDHYRVVSITEDDLVLIKGTPQVRRIFIDQALVIFDPECMGIIKQLKHIVENRNSMLSRRSYTREEYEIWTEQLWHCSQLLQERRKNLLDILFKDVNSLLADFFDQQLSVMYTYNAKNMQQHSFDQFLHDYQKYGHEEQRYGYSLFGGHLDDFTITFQDRISRNFASRGQQKLIVFLLKVAYVLSLVSRRGPVLFIIDDFMTDFDEHNIRIFSTLLAKLNVQLIITAPLITKDLEQVFGLMGAQIRNFTD